jgi:hypothetical protein
MGTNPPPLQGQAELRGQVGYLFPQLEGLELVFRRGIGFLHYTVFYTIGMH